MGQQIKLPEAIEFPAPTSVQDLSALANVGFTFSAPELEAAWTILLEAARAKTRGANVKNELASQVLALRASGANEEARVLAATAEPPVREALVAFLGVRQGTAHPDTVWAPLAEAASQLRASDLYNIVTALAYRYGAPGGALLAQYVIATGASEQSQRWVARDITTWPASAPGVGPEADQPSFGGQPQKGDGSRPLQRIVIEAVAAVWDAIDAPEPASSPIAKGEFETSEAFQTRVEARRKLDADKARWAQEEWRSRFASRFGKEVSGQGLWKMSALAFDADRQQFTGAVEVNGVTRIPVRFPTKLDDAPRVKDALADGEVEPIFAINKAGDLVLSSLELAGGGMLTKVALNASVGLNVGKDAVQPLRTLAAAVAAEREKLAAAERLRQKELEEQEQAKAAQAAAANAARPEVQACLQRVQTRYGSSGGVNVGALAAQARAAQACHDLPTGGATSAVAAVPADPASRILPAGRAFCVNQRDAIQYTLIVRRYDNAPLPASCQYAGSDLRVRELRSAQMGQATVVMVGNAGGTAWVAADELR